MTILGPTLIFCAINNPSLYLFAGPSTETPESQNLDYDFAQQELMLAQMGEDPVQEAITAMEKQHEDEKQGESP